MKAGIGTRTSVPPHTFVTNISSINDFQLCTMRDHNRRVKRRIKGGPKAHYLDTGTAGHKAVEDLHNQLGTWDPAAAVGIAEQHADALRQHVYEAGAIYSEKEAAKRLEFADYLVKAFPI